MNDKQQLQAMGEHQAEQSMCMAKQVESLQQQVLERNDWLVSLARAAAGMQPDCDLSGAPEYVSTALSRIAAAIAGELPDHGAGVGKNAEPLAWRNTGHPNGLKRFLTQKQHEAQTPGVQQWFEPIRFKLPKGWQIVPVEPTPEMVEAYFAGKMEAQNCTHQLRARERVVRDYKAMLAAAPYHDQPDTAWTDAPAPEPTPQDYRELQERHDRLLSEHKAAVDALRGCGLPVQDYAVVLESVALAIDLRAATAGKPVPAALTTDDLRTVAAALGGTVHDRPLD